MTRLLPPLPFSRGATLGLLCLAVVACGADGAARDLLVAPDDAEGVTHDVAPEGILDVVAEASDPGAPEPDPPERAEFVGDAAERAEPVGDAAGPADAAEVIPGEVTEPQDAPGELDAIDLVEPVADASEAVDAPPEADVTPPPSTCVFPAAAKLANARVPAGYCAWTWAEGLGTPRGLTVAPNGDVLVVERAGARVRVLFDADGDGVSGPDERAQLVATPGLNHGLALHGGYLYASSSTAVYRWPYAVGARSNLGDPETVVQDIPSGGHATRTLAFDAAGRLYVSVGSGSNLDTTSERARVRRFSVAQVAAGGIAFDQGEVFADGLRNEVGLAFDGDGVLWGVENGMDNLARPDLGGDLHNTNPAEEVNRFAVAGAFYGYPYCWSEYLLPQGVGEGPGAQWVHPSFADDGVHGDAWCKDPGQVTRPVFAMPPHVAPLDVLFYRGSAFPADAKGDAFVSWHGSWNSDVPVGRKVVRLRRGVDGLPATLEPLLEYVGPGDVASDWPHRPVGLAVDVAGRLLVTSDATGVVIAIGYDADGSQEPPTLLPAGGSPGLFGCALSSRW